MNFSPSHLARVLCALALTACSTAPMAPPPRDVPIETAVDVVDETFIGTGNLTLAWTVRGMPAATGCAAAGGTTVRFGANFIHFMRDTEVPCTQGQLVLQDVSAIQSDITAELLSADGTVVHRYTVDAAVRPGMPNMSAIRFEPAGTLTVRYTINGQSPSAGCPSVDAQGVQVELRPVRTSLGVRCPGSGITFTNRQVGPANIAAVLVGNGMRGRLNSVESMADVVAGENTIVTVAFEAPEVPRDAGMPAD